jgi:cell division protein FtsW
MKVTMKLKKGPPDFILFLTLLILLGLGLIMVFSSSSVTTGVKMNDAYYYFKRQLLWVVIGFIAMGICMRLPYVWFKQAAYLCGTFSLLMLVLVLTPLGVEVKGAVRWLRLGPVQFAPSDLAKVAMVMVMARALALRCSYIKAFKKGLLPFLLLLGAVCGLIMKQPDLGTTAALAGTVFCMLVMAGARWLHLLMVGATGAALGGLAILAAPYRLDRIRAFLDPWQYAQNEGYQIIQSLYALGSGGIFGLGLGQSRQKFFYLPEQHTDFIYAILGEELGFIGAFFVIMLFLLLAWRGFRVAMNAPDHFTSLLAGGLTAMIVLQAVINIGVVIGALPVTGITLPFISYGGTSLLFSMISIGIILNISRYNQT